MKRDIEKELEKHSFDAHLKEELKNPRFKKAYEEGLRKLKLGYQIFLTREGAGITQMELARRIGTRQSNISRLEQGDYNFTVEMLEKIAKALNAELKIEFRPADFKKAA